MKYYLRCLQKYAEMTGRAGRKEFWQFALVNCVITFILNMAERNGIKGMGMISMIYSLVVLLPSLSVGVRRFHDLGRSGKSYACYVVPISICSILIPVIEWATKPSTGLIASDCILGMVLACVVLFLPIVLGIMLLIVLAKRGQPEANQYGEPPLD